jgi:hypothetical protein
VVPTFFAGYWLSKHAADLKGSTSIDTYETCNMYDIIITTYCRSNSEIPITKDTGQESKNVLSSTPNMIANVRHA